MCAPNNIAITEVPLAESIISLRFIRRIADRKLINISLIKRQYLGIV